jgi:hypothetical protein
VVASKKSGPVAVAQVQEKPGDVLSVHVELESLDRTAGFEIVASGLPKRALVLWTRLRSFNEQRQRARLRHRSVHEVARGCTHLGERASVDATDEMKLPSAV